MFIKAFITVGLASMVLARPQFITFKDGRVGVNFGGYHASAGLGGLLTGDSAHGGLQAEAGTPWGARAGAGLGGDASGQGRTSGGLYAGAASGFGHSAGAELAGSTSAEGSYGVSVAGAKGVGVGVVKTVEVEQPTPVVTNAINKNVEIVNTVETTAPVEKVVPAKQVSVVETVPAAHAGFTFTKTVQPVAYVTKTVQAAPVVATRVKVAEVEQMTEAPKKEVVQEVAQEVPQYYNTVYLRKRFRPRHFYKHYGFYPAVQYASNVEVVPAPVQAQVVKQVSIPVPPPVVRTEFVKQVQVQPAQVVKQVEVQPVQVIKEVQPVQTHVVKQVSVPAQGSFAAQGGFTVGGSKGFFDDIFNIPISTLGAVNQFLNNRAAAGAGASGSVQFSKQVYG
ncbi:uncharacterized protein LOC113375860 [Ctenocephalides felis]|uniref:uncharacterized protein LOC113375860 n=1 Tax=Ctenocephalides felis TaxID=7515 RepID=UPI000E6E2A25|nr:uncharacterized protein LOC113375860 [Ctenocephalides felis]XP_026471601.1 uncharacterized protein LOC113375860 [Ctenocephalides felis]